ncbi:hypothetical protein [uncultured Croceitalea sp.]|uniref:hypothetical protein n=1 Tax=uncultured Croceitalea sp. TaxID=1798908 RepID=UPI0033056D49
MKIVLRIFTLIFFCSILSCKQEKLKPDFKVVYKNNKKGETLMGSKAELIKYIRAGASIKIGWGSKGKTRSVEHLSEPIWIAVLNESEVVVHLDPHYVATADWNNLTSKFSDTSLVNQEWRVVITTGGNFDAVWYDKFTGTMIKRVPQNHTMTWFAKGSYDDNVPLYLNE